MRRVPIYIRPPNKGVSPILLHSRYARVSGMNAVGLELGTEGCACVLRANARRLVRRGLATGNRDRRARRDNIRRYRSIRPSAWPLLVPHPDGGLGLGALSRSLLWYEL